MSRLRNRMIKAEFYMDAELLRWPSAKRDLYRSMWAMAEDSACIEDDPFGWKCAAWPSPLDAETHSEAKFTIWRAELIAAGKVVPYKADGGHYLFLPDMARHEHPRNPQAPNLPLPEWVTYTPGQKKYASGAYAFDFEVMRNASETPAIPEAPPVLPCPALPGPDRSCPKNSSSPPGGGDGEFDSFWALVPRKVGKGQARKAFTVARKKAGLDVILAGITRYAAEVRGADQKFTAHPATWLTGERWTDEPAKHSGPVLTNEPNPFYGLCGEEAL